MSSSRKWEEAQAGQYYAKCRREYEEACVAFAEAVIAEGRFARDCPDLLVKYQAVLDADAIRKDAWRGCMEVLAKSS